MEDQLGRHGISPFDGLSILGEKTAIAHPRIGSHTRTREEGMRTPIVRGLTLAAIAATLAGFAPRAIADEEAAPAAAAPAPITSGKVGGNVKVTATVEDVDVDKRIVKL